MSLIAFFIALNFILTLLLFFIALRVIRKSLSSKRHTEAMEREVGALVTELNQTAERNILLLEEKIKRLRELVNRADRKIKVLEREKEREPLRVYSELKGRIAAPESEPEPEPELPAGGEAGSEVDNGKSGEGRKPPELETPKEPASPAEGEKSGYTEPRDEEALRKAVVAMERQGLGSIIISRKLNLSMAEVDLILSIYGSRNKDE